MATGTAGTTAREFTSQQVHYLRRSIAYTDDGNELDIGIIPAGSLILKPLSGVSINTPFNASGGNVLQVGGSAGVDDPNRWGTSLALGTAGFVPCDEAVSYLVTVDVTISATVELTGTAATAGQGEVVIAYIPDNDQ